MAVRAATSLGRTFDVSSSSTATRQTGTLNATYGGGESVTGPIYTDTVTVSGVLVKDQYFSPATTELGFSGTEAGVLGLSLASISDIKQPPFFQHALALGLLPSGVLGLRLGGVQPEALFGGTNPALYSGLVELHPIDPARGFWQVPGATVTVAGTPVPGLANVSAIIDSGTAGIVAPPAYAARFWGTVPGAKEVDAGSGVWTYPCAFDGPVAFSWGGREWALSAADLNGGSFEDGTCIGNVFAADLHLGDNVWVLGTPFLNGVYAVFSLEDMAVGFAAAT